SGLSSLTSHANVTRRFILQKARHHSLTRSDYLYAHGFRNYFTPLPGCFSPFPHGTGSLSVTREYLALRDGPRGFRRGFTCPAVLRILNRECDVSSTGLSHSMSQLPNCCDYVYIWLLLFLVLHTHNTSIFINSFPYFIVATHVS